ncbi:MAG: cytochrome c maturation protein CcmE [Magnetococcales bacterium]|nr:cytochrome c maturation protein CcmE [Magnetococcales bacterium]
MTSNRKRWLMVGSLVAVLGALGLLVFTSFTDALVYFFTPTEIQDQSAKMADRKIRIGGMVQEGSLKRTSGTLQIRFLITDGQKDIPVFYDGVLPDLFREGQGVVAEGVWKPGETFIATTILAKHSEDYIPIEMSEEGIAKSKKSLLDSLK